MGLEERFCGWVCYVDVAVFDFYVLQTSVVYAQPVKKSLVEIPREIVTRLWQYVYIGICTLFPDHGDGVYFRPSLQPWAVHGEDILVCDGKLRTELLLGRGGGGAGCSSFILWRESSGSALHTPLDLCITICAFCADREMACMMQVCFL